MKTMCPERKGDIVDIETGKVVGRHDGILKYTTGQRRGVGVGGQKDAVGRWFVVDKDIKIMFFMFQPMKRSSCLASELFVKILTGFQVRPNRAS